MNRELALLLILGLTAPIVHGAQAPIGAPRTVTIVLSGPALSSGAAQEAILLGIHWVDFADQLFPRQNVRVRVDYWWRPGKTTVITEDARQRPYDPDRAKFLLTRSKFSDRQARLTFMCNLDRPEAKRGTYWLLEQLKRMGMATDSDVKHDRRTSLESLTSEAVLWVRID